MLDVELVHSCQWFLINLMLKYPASISPGMVEKSRELLGERADLRVGDSEHLPWNDESFDIVTCIASFHHYPNPEPVLREMKRVLKHGGSLIIADPWAPNPWRSLANFIARTRLLAGTLNDAQIGLVRNQHRPGPPR